ncbi:hypothetical protein [Pararobbsia silviterrae]|uniref:hypothetical protein n=1 Tax=Pararobbsia silviterrae TaxID=1792498 RepID=UPI0011C46599|nr:hypothetical protein [Pararobbsia silviterrae]
MTKADARAEFFCFTCSRHKDVAHKAVDQISKKPICNSCDARRAKRPAAKSLTPRQVKRGHSAIFNHLHRIGEL